MRRTSLLVAIVIASMSVVFTSTDSLAFRSYLNTFNDRYGTAGTPLDECGLCHRDFNGNGPGNAYYDAWSAAGRNDAAFVAIENEDSDGDGTLNIDEILAETYPGWTCDTYANAINAPNDLAQHVDPDNRGCSTLIGPEIDVTPLSISFGSVEVSSSATLDVAVHNLGDVDLEVMSLSLSGSAEFTVLSPSAPFLVEPGSSQAVTLRYMPTNEGFDTATLEIASNDADEPTTAVSVDGTGIPGAPLDPEIDVTPLTLDFGSLQIGGSASEVITVRNLGNADLTVSSVTLDSEGEFSLDAPTTPFSVEPGMTREISVGYTAVAEGSHTGSVVISSDDADESTVTIDLAGSGVQAPPAIVDLEIAQLRAEKRVDIERLQSVEVNLTVKNVGLYDEERLAVLEVWQDGTMIYTTEKMVSDEVGNGRSRYTFGSWIPSQPGIITWVVRILDDDETDDVASVETLVIHRERMAGANLAGADLRGEYLAGCDLTGADLRGADLSRADLSGAIGLSTTLFDEGTRYSPGTLFGGTGFNPAAAGWTLVEDSTITRDHTFSDVKARFTN
jgi:hypothetical protein